MPYSFTEKKRIRKSFAKREDVLDVPFSVGNSAAILFNVLTSQCISYTTARSRIASSFYVDIPYR